jgi:NAD(P)-dependent dehydrogenase (short-subunit alcohol dehydrogenase family)
MTTGYKQEFGTAAFPRVLLAVLALIAALAAPITARADTVMITGANSGIGLEFAKQYAEQGWTVIATHRARSRRRRSPIWPRSIPRCASRVLDVTNLEQAQQLAAKLADVPIDVLINNAGVYNDRAEVRGG